MADEHDWAAVGPGPTLHPDGESGPWPARRMSGGCRPPPAGPREEAIATRERQP